jgi:hypothetical protein
MRITKVETVKRYEFTTEDMGLLAVEFRPVANVPGFSHRVIVKVIKADPRQVALDWLGNEFRPSAKVAKYYLEKHQSEIA